MVQDGFLTTLKTEKTPVSIFLVSGIQLTGRIHEYDNYTITITSSSGIQLVFKQQITTIQASGVNNKSRENRRTNRLFR